MGSEASVRLTGSTQFVRSQGGDRSVLSHETQLTIADCRAVIRVTSDETARSDAIASTHPAVTAFLLEYDAMMARTAYRERPINPIFKERSVHPEPQMPAGFDWCPECLGDPELATICDRCDGNRIVRVDNTEA